VLLTDPFTLEHFDLVATIFPGHDIGILFLQSRLDNGLELFCEAVPPFTKGTGVVRADVGNRVDGELRVGTDVHRTNDEAERRDEAAGENCRFRVSTVEERGWGEGTHSNANRPSLWGERTKEWKWLVNVIVSRKHG